MEKELINFIDEYELSPFSKTKTLIRTSNNSIFKTKDARDIYSKVLNKISNNFVFSETSNLLNFFSFVDNFDEIKRRQEFFKTIPQNLNNESLKDLKTPRNIWKPNYDIIVVTENDKTLLKLKEMNCPVKFLLNENDVRDLEARDIVQILDCEEFNSALEILPQSVILNSTDEAYLERYVEVLSGWKYNLEILKENPELNTEIKNLLNELIPLLKLCDNFSSKELSRDIVEQELGAINKEISFKLKEMTLSGESLMSVLKDGSLPQELKDVVNSSIKKSSFPHLYINKIPVEINEESLENALRQQSLTAFISQAENIKKYSSELISLPEKIKKLSSLLILFDFESGISKFLSDKDSFPDNSEDFSIERSNNFFLSAPQPVSFSLNNQYRCSILTGANSGGKTTLLEHIIQSISFFHLGLPTSGKIKIPLFTEIYYFAKNKGSMSKGAFETLLTQMSQVKPGNKTLILADEIEAVTEPGVAGKIISATAEYFINKNCFLVIATHLGYEIQKNLPIYARIDGIEAKGLDEQNELIVDHNPVLGKIANSTPELIVEKMARSESSEYFYHIHNYLKKSKL